MNFSCENIQKNVYGVKPDMSGIEHYAGHEDDQKQRDNSKSYAQATAADHGRSAEQSQHGNVSGGENDGYNGKQDKGSDQGKITSGSVQSSSSHGSVRGNYGKGQDRNRDQVLPVVFHLYVYKDTDKAVLEFTQKPKLYDNLTINLKRSNSPICKDDEGSYWMSDPIRIHPDEVELLRYKYTVTYSPTRVQKFANIFFTQDLTSKEVKSRKLFGNKNQFDVHKDKDKDTAACIIAGQLFYVKMLYENHLGKGRNLKEMLFESEHVGLGNPMPIKSERQSFLTWISKTIESRGLTSQQSAFLCTVLSQLYSRVDHKVLLQNDLPNSKHTIDSLLLHLSGCKKEHLTDRLLEHISRIGIRLIQNSSFWSKLGYVQCFSLLFDSAYVVNEANYYSNTPPNEFDDNANKALKVVLQLEEKEDKDKLIAFVVKQASSISSLWKMARCLEYEMSVPVAIVDKFRNFFTYYRRTDVLEKSVWHGSPHGLRRNIAVPFCEALEAHLVKQSVEKAEHERLVELILDRDLQEFAGPNLLKIMKILLEKHETDVVIRVLQAQNFFLFWEKSKSSNKEDIVCHLVTEKIKCHNLTRKEQVVQAFRVFQDLTQIMCLQNHEDLLAKCVCQETQRLGLKAIVDAYDEIQQLPGQATRSWYMELLINTVQVEQAKPDVKFKLLDSIFNADSSAQDIQIDGGREEILLFLLNQTQIPSPKSSTTSQDKISTIVKAVLSDEKLWKIVFQVTGKVNRLHSHANYLAVKQGIDEFSQSIINGDLTVSFVAKSVKNHQKDIMDLLTLARCCPPQFEAEGLGEEALRSKWLKAIDSLLTEKEIIKKQVDHIKHAIDLANEITGDPDIILQDYDVMLQHFNDHKATLPNTKLNEVRKENYWGPLKFLLDIPDDLIQLTKCILFKNFAVAMIRKYVLEVNGAKEDGDGNEECEIIEHQMTLKEVLMMLTTDGTKSFKNMVQQVIDENSTVPSNELDRLLADIDETNIKDEFRNVCEIISIPPVLPNVLKMLQNYVKFDDVKNKVRAVLGCLLAVGYVTIPEDSSDYIHTLQAFLMCKDAGTLSSIAEEMDQDLILKINHQLSSDLVDTLIELSNSEELIEFIIKTANDNMVDLIEAVEEHSDQLIQETTVSYLIDVHRFLRKLLSNKPPKAEEFLNKIVEAYTNLLRDMEYSSTSKDEMHHQETKMAAKIKIVSCNVHSLRGLHMMMSNRGEITKEIIKSAVKYGIYEVSINEDGLVNVQLSYMRQDQNKSEAKYNLDDLNDLRSRALLMVNADKSNAKVIDGQVCVVSQEDLKYFVDQVDRLVDIVRNYKELKMSGVPRYETRFWKVLKTMDEIVEEERRVNEEVEFWNKLMTNMRQQHFFLNYFHRKQLWLLKAFFHENVKSAMKDTSGEVLSLFRCIDAQVNKEDLPYLHVKYLKPKRTGPEHELHAIGSALEEIFKVALQKTPSMVDSVVSKDDAVVMPGKLYVDVLEPGSVQTPHVIMSLYENTCACLPNPSQLLFCNSNTTWEEIELLLLRTFEAHRHGITSTLHCIGNVESLPNSIQFKLVDALKTRINESNTPYLLAVVCRGGPHHHIADQFADFVHFHGGIADADMREQFEMMCPETYLITGDLPGLGKSEEIYYHAGEQKKTVVTFPISGPFVRGDIVKRLSNLNLKSFQSLHLDIGDVDDPAGLDTFLFELVVTKMVSSGALMFSMPTDHIYIEIANTLEQGMRNALPVCKCFKKLPVTWKDYSNLRSSEEVTSAIQVVCQYLNVYEQGRLEYQEVSFTGKTKVQPLTPIQCKALLKKYFNSGGDLSFNILENFLSVLADQLLKFSRSPYFKPEHLKDMIGSNHDIRVRLFKALLEVSISFAARSINACKTTQADALSKVKAQEALKKMKSDVATTADQIVDRVKGMVQWADNKHLVIMLHGAGAITAIYQSLNDVPQNIKDLFKSQAIFGKGLEDYTKMTQEELQDRLERFSDAPLKHAKDKLTSFNYALTPDNILKMALIVQRMHAGIPVIIMGETGCGKTSLVRYLAHTCGIPFEVFSFHAGITEIQIVDFIARKDKEARTLQKDGKSMWIFLDEINTCDYLGTINEIVCHRSIQGRPLASNLMFVAACNPYRLRPPGQIMTAGLTGKTTFDEFSKLVYRVHPLPETMIDYVWDYGSLSPDDEKAYIGRMVETLFDGQEKKLLVELLASSQQFLRDEEQSSFCVSLRDVHRSTILMEWFYNTLRSRPTTDISKHPYHLHKFFNTAQKFSAKERAIVLTLAHCYLSRLPATSTRRKYCRQMTDLLTKHGKHMFLDADAFQHILRAEQEDYLSRMELPEGTAKNGALRENIFVVLVCILNKIPVFVVGKPGCSKSLSVQIIRSNLRGRDSKDPFLKTLPQLLFVSFQGSESSTSEGIEKIFEKARKCKSKSENVLPVVLLDEIGLAEVSKFNPLKVLHRLLEPGEGEFPDVAVVGISNWALDAAKMNRAIHLSRPEPDIIDLYETGLSIRNTQTSRTSRSLALQIRCLAEAYHEYQCKQQHDNFHGLRDFYSMVKCLDTSSRNLDENSRKIQRAMQRNFGGLITGKGELQSSFLKKLEVKQTIGDVQEYPVADLIQDNLHDKMARHLMIITSGDSAIGILDQTLKDLNKEKITIFGSRFEEDLSPDYSHRILSRIILCMEHNSVLILRDLESIYGSLYDMLNQNYIVVGGKKNCRVALGAFSNPMCQVDDGFRCIVLIDQNKVDYSDPPFLNRFEKQLLRFSDVLDERQKKMIKELEEWTESISSIDGHEFDEFDMFAGFHDDTLPSIVLLHCQDPQSSNEEVIEKCKDDLMNIAMPDAVIRSRSSKLNKVNDEEVKDLYQSYFEKPIHEGLQVFLQNTLEKEKESECLTPCMKLLVMTHSSIHTDVSKCLENSFQVQTEKLSFFKSEKELSKRIKYFWMESKANLLVVQCRPETDAPHMLLVKTIIEEHRKAFISFHQTSSSSDQKHVCIVVHLCRSVEVEEEYTYHWQFNFLSGWSQVMVDSIEKPAIQIKEMLELTTVDVIRSSEAVSFHKVATDQLLWCFTRIKYPLMKQPTLEYISSVISAITSCPEIMESLMMFCCSWIASEEQRSNSEWQIAIACDREMLINSSTLVKAMEYFIAHLVRRPLARIIFFLQEHSAFEALTSNDAEQRQECLKLLSSESMFKISEIPEPQGTESLVVDVMYTNLNFPFSSLFCKRIETLYDIFLKEYRRGCLEDHTDEGEELSNHARMSLIRKISMKVEQLVPEILESKFLSQHISLYVDDFLDMKTDEVSSFLACDQRIAIMKTHYDDNMPPDTSDVASVVAQIHCNFWLDQNGIPQVFYFIKDCLSMNLPCMAIDNLLSQFHLLEEQDNLSNDVKDDCLDHDEDQEREDLVNEQNQLKAEPAENEEPFDEMPRYSVEESHKQSLETEPSMLTTQREDLHGDERQLTNVHENTDFLEEESREGSNEGPRGEEESEERNGGSEGACESKDLKEEQHAEFGEERQVKEKLEEDDNISKTTFEEEDNQGGSEGAFESEAEEEEEFEEERQVEEKREEENDISKPTFEQFIVEQVCLWFLPTDNCVEFFGGIAKWKNAAALALSSATKNCDSVPVAFYLKVCSDFVSLIPSEDQPYTVFVLGECGKQVEDDSYLDSPEIFQTVHECIQILLEQGVDKAKLEEFCFRFYERCIEANPDTPMLKEILSKVSSSNGRHMLQLASSIIHQILLTEEEGFSLQNLEHLMTLESLDEFPNLIEIKLVLSPTKDEEMEFDCPINVICCDLINKLSFKDLDIEPLSSSSDLPLNNFHTAVNVLSESDDKCKENILGFLCATAYLRAFMTKLAQLISKGKSAPQEALLNDVFISLRDGETPSRKSCIAKFLLKELAQVMCLHDIKSLIQKWEKPHLLKMLGWGEEDESTYKLALNPFKPIAASSSAAAALGVYVETKDATPLKKVLISLNQSPKAKKELASVMAEQFYVVRSNRKLKDTEESVAQFVVENMANVTTPYKNLITVTANRQSFKSAQLEVSPQFSTIQVEVAVLIHHLSTILASSFTRKSKNPIMCLLANPSELSKSYLIATPNDELGFLQFRHHQTIPASQEHLFLCACGTRFSCQVNNSNKPIVSKCPCCQATVDEDAQNLKKLPKAVKGYIKCNLKALQNKMLHVRSLEPVEFRVLHLIVHCALLGGFSLDLSTGVLPDVLKEEDPSKMCYSLIEIDLDVLATLLCCKRENIITLLHHIIEEVSMFLTEDSGLPLPHSETTRASWESYFSQKVRPLIKRFRSEGFYSPATHEVVIEERDVPQFKDVTSRNACIPRLFRTTQPNTFHNLQDFFLNSPKDVQENHPLLGLFLDYHDTLSIIANLAPLISFSRQVESLLSRAITRKDAKEKNIHDTVLSTQTDPHHSVSQSSSKASLKEAFEEFRQAWKSVVPLMNSKIEEGAETMQPISEMSPVGYCLTEKQDLGAFLCRSISVLTEIQNEFLDKCLAIASTGKCPALQFLCKDGSTYHFPIVHIQNAKKREIIKYVWTDDFLGHSFQEIEYGQGRNITYDMAKIEKDMAGCFLLGKAYLDTSSGIREFVFSKQLFHDCASILNELGEVIPQEKLPNSVEAELDSSAKKSMDRIQTLLEHMELVLCYLKHLGVDPNIALVEYVDAWISKSRPFPKDLFPTTLDMIQIKHVCALYEFVEDLLAVPSVECVDETYVKDLHDETKTKLVDTCKDVKKAELEAVLGAIKRFVFRYLHMKPHPDECLVEFMKDPSLWPMALRAHRENIDFDVLEVAAKFFPKEVTVGQIYELHQFYGNALKELNARLAPQRFSGISPSLRTTKTSMRTNKKKRKTKSGGFS